MTIETENKTKKNINLKVISKIERAVAGRLSLKKNVKANIFFLPASKIKKLNWESRHVAATTDVLSFPLYSKKPYKPDAEGMVILGDIMIDPFEASKKARKNKMTEQEEIIFLIVHGLLHLCGFDHDTDKKEIRMNNVAAHIIKDINDEK
jgi:probable rRNA maturation factor